MMSRATIHVISHTHWDREWYMPFEKHRRRLVMLLDALLDLMDRDPEFRHFHMDGQIIPIEDYLEIRPHQRERIERASAEGRLSLGPWYVLQDEFLTSGEANVRNLMLGFKLSRKYGAPIRLGYLPDSFGNISQMPQILRGFGIDNAVFGRGIHRWREEGYPDAEPEAQGYRSELIWRSPDGSEVLAIFMANWYNNAMTIPTDPEEVVPYIRHVQAACERYATTSQLLFMNGCDHTPSQPDVTEAIRVANEHLDDVVLIHSNFNDYLDAVRTELGDLQVKVGEMRSEISNGWGTLANVLSSRIYQKQANWRCQTLLEKWVEPFSAFAWKLGEPYDADFIWYAWKTLMQNHPHDSICGCSCDEVHREMDVRFEKCHVLSEQLAADALGAIAGQVDTHDFASETPSVVVFNPLNAPRREMAVTFVDFPQEANIADVQVFDAQGHRVPSHLLEDQGVVWDYKLPEVGFRIPYHTRRLRVAFLADVPPTGYATYQVVPSERQESRGKRVSTLENAFLRVDLLEDGRFHLTDKDSGVRFENLHALQDSLDVGDEYNYRAPEHDEIISPFASDTHIELIWQNEVFSHTRIETKLRLSGGPMPVVVTLILPHESRRLHVRLEVLNEHTNHRLRVLFPTEVHAEYASADGQFEVVRRRIQPWTGWENPSNCQPQQAFVDVSDATRGLTVANRGLPEYEILRDGKNTIALTLLRAVGELGDWGVFPTPDAQCQGRHAFEYALIPHTGSLASSPAALEARAFNVPLSALQTEGPGGKLPTSASFIALQPSTLVLSCVKKAEEREGLIVRFYQPFDESVVATLRSFWPISEAYRCNLAEERQERLSSEQGALRMEVGPKQIVTCELV